MSYTKDNMSEENRQNTRYSEIGRVVAPEICPLNGVLDDISLTGCKVHFPCIAELNYEDEYNIQILFSRSPEDEPLQLLCQPIWVKHEGGATEIGFSYMYSPDENRLKEFISYLENLSDDDLPEIL